MFCLFRFQSVPCSHYFHSICRLILLMRCFCSTQYCVPFCSMLVFRKLCLFVSCMHVLFFPNPSFALFSVAWRRLVGGL